MHEPTLDGGYVVGLIQRLFPFCFALDAELRVVHIGPKLGKICPAAGPGVPFTDIFTLFLDKVHGKGGILNVINNIGGSSTIANPDIVVAVVSYP